MDKKYRVKKANPTMGWTVDQTVTLDETEAKRHGTDLELMPDDGTQSDVSKGPRPTPTDRDR